MTDFYDAIVSFELWSHLAFQDIRLRYRRSKIGPLWITLSMAIFCGSLGIVYSQMFKMPANDYVPFLSTSYVIWGLISGMLTEFPNAFIDNSGYLKDIKFNPLVIVLRIALRHIIVFMHNIIIVVMIYFIYSINPLPGILIFFPSFMLVVLNLIFTGIILSILGARYRDVGPIVISLLQVLFFITPITWLPSMIADNNLIVILNPMYYYLDLLRSPLLGKFPQTNSFIVSILTLVLLLLASARTYKRHAHKIPFWV